MPAASSSKIRAPGQARRIGEWVAMTNCAPARRPDDRGEECDVEEALGPQEVAVARLRRGEDRLERAVEHRARDRGQLAQARQLAALGREAHGLGDRLDQRRLAGPVVARQEGHGRV